MRNMSTHRSEKAQSVTHTHSHTISIPHLRKDHPQRTRPCRLPLPLARSQSASPRLLESGRRKKARRALLESGSRPGSRFATPDVHVYRSAGTW